MRLTLAKDYSDIYVYNLRGNRRTSGELNRKGGRPIFEFGGWGSDGSEIKSNKGGSRATIAIVLLVKTASKAGGRARIHYAEVADYLSAGEKILAISSAGEFSSLSMSEIVPNDHGDWINQRGIDFGTYPPLGDKRGEATVTYFSSYSRGLETGRDAWVYNFSESALSDTVRGTVEFFSEVQDDYGRWLNEEKKTRSAASREEYSNEKSEFVNNPKKFSWTLSARNRLSSGTSINFSPDSIVYGTYRPFEAQWVYYNRALNHIVGRLPSMFPSPTHTNFGFYLVGAGSAVPFSLLMLRHLPNLHVTGAGSGGQFFPRYLYEKSEAEDGTLDLVTGDGAADEWGYRRVDNITDEILTLYRRSIGEHVTKDDIFYFVYGILHDPAYRTRYAADLKKIMPHIPTPDSADRFTSVSAIGCHLAELHLNYEAAQPYPLDVQLKPGVDASSRETWRVDKMRWRSKTDRDAIVYNSAVTIAGIPEEAHDYVLGSRTALEWIIDRYQVKADKASGIVNDPNDWCDEHDDPTYIVNLIKKITTVSVETVALVEQLSR